MGEAGRWIVWGLLLASVAVLVGVPVLVTPRFSGSLTGGSLGIAGAVLMLLSFAYIGLRRVRGQLIGLRRIKASRLLLLHIAAGLTAAALGLVHTGNLVRSPMGVGLLLTLLGILATGAVGRYQLKRLSAELQANEEDLLALRKHLGAAAADAPGQGAPAREAATSVVSAIADVEAAQQISGVLKAAFRRWMIAHVLLSITMLAILALHIVSAFYLGLRWWP